MMSHYTKAAITFQGTAFLFFIIVLVEATVGFVDLNVTADAIGNLLMVIVDALLNKAMVQMMTIDFVLDALVKLR